MHSGAVFTVPKPVASEYPEVEGTRCVQVKIPDDVSFLPVLAAMVAALGNTWSSVGGVAARQKWAEMWQRAYSETDWSGCMDCESLIECLTPILEGMTQDIINSIENFQQFGTNNPGQPFTNEQILTNLAGGTNPGCDLDILWAQCLALVQFTNRAATDIFERVEAATNVVELAGLGDDVPFIGIVLKLFGAELATNAVNYWQEAIAEGYAAEYTETLEYDLACRLFCVCRTDCIVTIDRVYDVFYSLVSDVIPTNPLEWLELLALLAGIDMTAETVVVLVFWALWGSAKLGQMMFETVTLAFLQTLLGLAVNDASEDWILLCTDCTNYTVQQFDVYSGGAPVDTREEDWGEQTFNALDTSDPGIRWILRLEFVPSVKLNYVSHTGSQTVGGLNPAEDFYDWVDFENTFVFFDGTELPTIDEFDGRCLKRLYLQSSVPFTITIDVQPADCEPTP